LASVKRKALLTILGLLAGAPVAHPQTIPASGVPGTMEEAPPERPGLFRVGTFYLTPYINIGSMGVDTNVFYSATDRQSDFIASGGPGLEIVRPFGRASRFRLDGGLDYLYFAKTDSQRKLNGYGTAQLQVEGVKTRVHLEESYATSFSRPNYQVDERVQQETEGTRAFLRRTLGDRFALALFGNREHTTTDSQDYLGTDVGQTLTEDQYQAGGELRLALSVKTQLVGGGEQDWYRFPRAPERDGEAQLAYGGFRTDETALIAGQALAGYRWFHLDAGGERSGFYASVDASWNVSPKTQLAVRYVDDITYSALETSGATPTNRTRATEVYLDKVLASNVYFRIFGRLSHLLSDGEVTIVVPGEDPTTAVRDDRVREAGAELGYQFRTRVRIGVRASYTTRKSTFETFGIEGLLAGLTVTYNPPQPTFR
jgi:Putative beta-barrel porin 2